MIERTAQNSIRPRFSLFALGLGATATQIVLLREVLASTGGNELIAALAVGLWLLLTGLGVLLGGRLAGGFDARPSLPPLGHLLLAVLPLPLLGLVRLWPTVAAVAGSQPDFPASLAGCLVTFLPYGLLSGAMVPLVGRTISAPGSSARIVFAIDSLGSAIGGAAVGALLFAGLPHVWCLAATGIPHLIAAAGRRPLPLLLGAAVLVVTAGTVDQPTLRLRYPGQRILAHRATPFGLTIVTRLASQVNVFRDATPLFSTGDPAAEARVHPALCQVPEGAHVLLVGGSLFGGAREARRHHPSQLDCVEQDRFLFELARPHRGDPPLLADAGPLTAPIRAIAGDGRAFVQQARGVYDAILLDLPGPVTAGWNRYYTREFFREAHAALRPGGVLAFALPSSPNYLGPEQLALERSIVVALREVFSEVVVLPGDLHFFLARNEAIQLEIAATLEARGIATTRLLDYDWPDLTDPFRREELSARLGLPSVPPAGEPQIAVSARESRPAPSAQPNEDLAPRAFRRLLEQRARVSEGAGWIAPLTLAAFLFLLLATRRRARLFAVASSGAAVMGMEMATLLLFQVICGELFLWLAAFVTLFLAGAALGAWLAIRVPDDDDPGGRRQGRRIARADLWVALGAILLLGVAHAATHLESGALRTLLGRVVLPGLACALPIPAGWQFAAAGAGRTAGSLAELYWADLAGAAFGTIAAGLVLLPIFGLTGVIAGIVLLKGASWMLQQLGSRR